MTGRDDSAFRLHMGRALAGKAREALARGDWREAALFARGAIESAAKAILACFTGVPRSHEPGDILREALAQPGFPEPLRTEGGLLTGVWVAYGMAEHVLLSYGDERNRVDPWSLVTEARAREAVATAETAVDFAARCITTVLDEPHA
ncbi:MAG: HEPN domain-containing protein [Myxococcota bacterium]|nr:HEPN domain-containing protein [Myxococcota bacterium]